MASILNSKATFYQCDPINGSNNKCGEPGEPIQSEADLYITTLARKQCDTNLTLQHCLKNEKQFESVCVYKSTALQTTGMKSHDEFQQLTRNAEEKTVRSNQPYNAPARNIGRHIKELALAVKPNSLETKLLRFAIDSNAIGEVSDTRHQPVGHPIHQLDRIENELFGHLKCNSEPRKTAKMILRKRKQLLRALREPGIAPSDAAYSASAIHMKSLWDVTESEENFRRGSTRIEERRHKLYSTCSMPPPPPPPQLFTVQDRKIVPLSNENQSEQSGSFASVSVNVSVDGMRGEYENESEQDEYRSRLDERQIKELPKFKNYDKGSPSSVLYLKNLASSVTEKDLVFLFSKYQSCHSDQSRITYKLMQKGKMRAQAFVEFHSLDAAVEAMNEVNGVILYNKPVIIQFGKSRK